MSDCYQILIGRVLFFLILSVIIFGLPIRYYQTITLDKKESPFRESPIELQPIPPYPIKNPTAQPPAITAKSVLALDLDSQVLLFEKNFQEKLPPASLTKLMTAIVVLENCNPKRVVAVGKLTKSGSQMGLLPGEKITIESLLYGLLLSSGNDAAYVLASSCLGSVEQFVYSMNMKAQYLGMKNTHFANPSGLDNPNHYSTAQDLAILSQEALKNKLIAKIVSTKKLNVTDVSGQIIHELENLNQLLENPEVLGIKTGRTQAAGENLILAREKNSHPVMVVILGSEDRFGEGGLISDWIFSNFKWHDF